MSTFGERLKSEREKRGLTQQQLADLLFVTHTTVSAWEKDREPEYTILAKITKLFQIDINDLLGIGNTQTEPKIEYDFYKYLNKEYDLKEHPELILEHFAYVEANPEKCKEIPKRMGEWSIVKKIQKLEYVNVICIPQIPEVIFKINEIIKKKYVFDIFAQADQLWGSSYNHAGKVTIDIDFTKETPQYCGEISFDFYGLFVREHGKGFFDQQGAREDFIYDVAKLIAKVFLENGIDDTFLITDVKENKFIIRQCETRKIHYFVIQKNSNNSMFWQYPIDEVTLKNEIAIKCDN